jgi:hypothetical protein
LYKLKLNQLGLQAAQSVAVEGSDTTILHKEAESCFSNLPFFHPIARWHNDCLVETVKKT